MTRARIASLNRRLLLSGASGLLAGLRAPESGAGQVPPPVETGDCADEPGVQLLIDFSRGIDVGVGVSELTPPPGWNLFAHPTLTTALFIPPDWIGIAAWADSYSRSGRPNWTDVRPEVPQLNLLRVVAPDDEIAFEYIVGNILGQPLRPEQVAQVGKQSLLGEEPDVDSVCTYVDVNPLSPAFLEADRFGGSVHVTSGFALGLDSNYLPATTVTIQNFFGPRRDFLEVSREIFLRFIVQFMGGGTAEDGGSGGDNGDDPDGDDPDDDGDDPDDE